MIGAEISRADWSTFTRFRTTKSHVWQLVNDAGFSRADWQVLLFSYSEGAFLRFMIGVGFALGDWCRLLKR